jgi:hypothetical protein
MRFLFHSRKSNPVPYRDMESSPSLLPSDESSGGGGSISDSAFHEEEPPRLVPRIPRRNMLRGGSFHAEEPPRLAPRRMVLPGESRESPHLSPQRKPLGSLDDESADEMRKVLHKVGALDVTTTPQHRTGWSARRNKEGRFSSKEPMWKRRLRNLKSSLVPELRAAEPTAEAIDQQQEHQRARNSFGSKNVSFDDISLNHPSAAGTPFATKKKQSQITIEKPNAFKRAGSSFTEFFRRVTEDDLFSVETPSFWSEQTSISTEDDITTITSYHKKDKLPKTRSRERAACGSSSEEQASCFICSAGDSVVDDLRLVAELLVHDATCQTFMTDEAIPQRRGEMNTSSS